MSIAKLDESIVPILENATDRVVIRGKDGRVVGVFHPTCEEPDTRISPNSDDDLRELQRHKVVSMSLDEFWKKMGVK